MKLENGEHPLGDTGQLICVALFLIIWIGDSFFPRESTFLSTHVPLPIRLTILGVTLLTAAYLSTSGHVVTRHEKRPNGVL